MSDPTTITSTPLITYTWLANGQIHEMHFAESSRQAVDEWLTVMRAIYANAQPSDTLRLLFDMSESGTMPLMYAIGEGKRFADSLPHHPTARVAMLHPSDRIRPFANAILGALKMGHLRTRFFDVDDRAGALAWLAD